MSRQKWHSVSASPAPALPEDEEAGRLCRDAAAAAGLQVGSRHTYSAESGDR